MTRVRSLLSLAMGALLLLAQLHAWQSAGCSMCGASCRCSSRAAGESCSFRSVGCGGDSGSAVGSASPLRAVLAAAPLTAPRRQLASLPAVASHLPPQPTRPPLDHPPRISC